MIGDDDIISINGDIDLPIMDMNVCPLSEKDKSYPFFFMECKIITRKTLHKQYGMT